MLESAHSKLRKNYIHSSLDHEYEGVGTDGPGLAEVNLSGQEWGLQLHEYARFTGAQRRDGVLRISRAVRLFNPEIGGYVCAVGQGAADGAALGERQLILNASPGGDPLHTSAYTANQIFVFERQSRQESGFVHFSTSPSSECVRIKHLPSRKYLAVGDLMRRDGSQFYTAELVTDEEAKKKEGIERTWFHLISKSGTVSFIPDDQNHIDPFISPLLCPF
jgi:hypothetical protein